MQFSSFLRQIVSVTDKQDLVIF